MKKIILFLSLIPTLVFGNDCRVTTASFESEGQFKTESVTVCKEGEPVPKKIKKGDTILETEVGSSNARVGYFKHQNATCRLFTERLTEDKKLKVYHGVICQVDNSPINWLVVDKW